MDLPGTIHLLGDLLGQVLTEQESPALFETEERIRAQAKSRRAGEPGAAEALAGEVSRLTPDGARAVASAFTLYFDLVNLAEERYRVRALRDRERKMYPAPVGESLAEAIGQIKARGVPAEEMAGLLENLNIELVLTAHPTHPHPRPILPNIHPITQPLN